MGGCSGNFLKVNVTFLLSLDLQKIFGEGKVMNRNFESTRVFFVLSFAKEVGDLCFLVNQTPKCC